MPNHASAAGSQRQAVPIQFSAALIIGVLVLGGYSYASKDPAKAFTIIFMLVGAALLVGVLVGFLFGVPKSRTETLGSKNDAITDGRISNTPPVKYSDNANLEEVSDWLTKIIVGIGLVEFDKILLAFQKVGELVEPILGVDGKIVIQGGVLYFLVLGFILSYVWTRVVFYGILLDRDQIQEAVQASVRREVHRIENEAERHARLNQTLNDFYVAIDVAKKTNPEKRDWGVLNNLNIATKKILKEDPVNRKAAVLSARFENEILNDEKSALACGPAIRILEDFLSAKERINEIDKDYADALFNKSGYNARIYLFKCGTVGSGSEETIRYRDACYRDLTQSIKISGTNAQDAQTDPDFLCFKDDDNFKRIIGLI